MYARSCREGSTRNIILVALPPRSSSTSRSWGSSALVAPLWLVIELTTLTLSCANHSKVHAKNIGPRGYECVTASGAKCDGHGKKAGFSQVRCQIELIDAAENGLPARHFKKMNRLARGLSGRLRCWACGELAPPHGRFYIQSEPRRSARSARRATRALPARPFLRSFRGPGTFEIGLANENNAATGGRV